MPKRKSRKTLMCQACGAPALKWAPACQSCGQLNQIIEVSVAVFEKRQAESQIELSVAGQAAVQRLLVAWRLPSRRLESAVRLLSQPRPMGCGLAEEQVKTVVAEAILQHEQAAKQSPVGFLISLGRLAATGEAVGRTSGLVGEGSSGWDELETAAPRPVADLLPGAREAPAPAQQPDGECSRCHGAGYYVVETSADDGKRAGRTEDCACRQETPERRTARLLRYSRMEGTMLDMRLDTLQPLPGLEEALRQADRFIQGEVLQLVLTGVTGSGKTHISAGIARRLIDAGEPVLYMNVARYLDQLRRSYDETVEETFDVLLQQVVSAPVLIIDDLGAERGTAWAREKVYEIVDSRYVQGLRMVASSNHDPETWDERVRSRLCDWQRSVVVRVRAPDYRLRRMN